MPQQRNRPVIYISRSHQSWFEGEDIQQGANPVRDNTECRHGITDSSDVLSIQAIPTLDVFIPVVSIVEVQPSEVDIGDFLDSLIGMALNELIDEDENEVERDNRHHSVKSIGIFLASRSDTTKHQGNTPLDRNATDNVEHCKQCPPLFIVSQNPMKEL